MSIEAAPLLYRSCPSALCSSQRRRLRCRSACDAQFVVVSSEESVHDEHEDEAERQARADVLSAGRSGNALHVRRVCGIVRLSIERRCGVVADDGKRQIVLHRRVNVRVSVRVLVNGVNSVNAFGNDDDQAGADEKTNAGGGHELRVAMFGNKQRDLTDQECADEHNGAARAQIH